MHEISSTQKFKERLYTFSIIAMQVCVKYQFSFMNDRLTDGNKTMRENFLTLTTYMFGFIGSTIGAFFARKYLIHKEIIIISSVLICIISLFLSNRTVSEFVLGNFYRKFKNTLDYLFYVIYGIILNAFYVVYYTLQVNYSNQSENKNMELQLARFSEKIGNFLILIVIYFAQVFYEYMKIEKTEQATYSPFISSFFCLISLLMIILSGVKFHKVEQKKREFANRSVWMGTFNFYFFIILMFLYSIHNIFFNYVNYKLIEFYGFDKKAFSYMKFVGVFYEIGLIAFFSKIVRIFSYEIIIIFTTGVKIVMCIPFAFNLVDLLSSRNRKIFFIILDILERTTVALFTSSIPQIILRQCDQQTYVLLEFIKSVIQFTVAYGAVGVLCAYTVNSTDVIYTHENIKQLHMNILYFMILMSIFSILYFLSGNNKKV